MFLLQKDADKQHLSVNSHPHQIKSECSLSLFVSSHFVHICSSNVDSFYQETVKYWCVCSV